MSGQVDETVGTPTEQPKRSSGGSRFIGIVGIIIGALMVIGGIAAWIGVTIQLSEENITVTDDAAFMQGATGHRSTDRVGAGRGHPEARPRGDGRQDLRRARPGRPAA